MPSARGQPYISIFLAILSQQQPFLLLFIDIDDVDLAHIPLPPLPQQPAARAGVRERTRSVAVVSARRFMVFS
ncbi:hypothetical protein ASG40_17965 [Methylobacterium sp. Leaf399]|nr:hypothetical protein ASF39_14070 [Methylobacterium sp. Leaf108]KQT16579.1 hypothetical protein ASG40_17965 [Methylobacterium sp. Leaf399]KQT86642.1 hypothetical protein ASG59_17300 [Methylobacterium sp. Leaf466]